MGTLKLRLVIYVGLVSTNAHYPVGLDQHSQV